MLPLEHHRHLSRGQRRSDLLDVLLWSSRDQFRSSNLLTGIELDETSEHGGIEDTRDSREDVQAGLVRDVQGADEVSDRLSRVALHVPRPMREHVAFEHALLV